MSDRDKKEAFVTLATNDTYSLGCLVLGNSLRRVKTTRQLVVMVTIGVSNPMRSQLAQVFDVIQEVNVLDSNDPINLSLLGRPDLNVTFTKLHCWRLTQFDKCVFLDADTLVLQNVDELFDREELSAAPDAGWPDCFNSGVFVFKPSLETYETLLQFATSQGSFDGGDQGLLNMYFKNWATEDISKHLPFIYNVVSQAFYSYLPAFTQFKDRVKIVHFIGAVKPWHHTYDPNTRTVKPLPGTGHSQEFLQVWWNIFMEMVQPCLDPSLIGLVGELASMTIQGASSPAVPLSDAERKLNWERGQIDYLGQDSFENIQRKIDETLNTSEPAPTPAPMASPFTPKANNSDPKPLETKPVEEPKPIAVSTTVPKPQASSTTAIKLQSTATKPIKPAAPTVTQQKNATEPKVTTSIRPQVSSTAKPAVQPPVQPKVGVSAQPRATAPAAQPRVAAPLTQPKPAAPLTQPRAAAPLTKPKPAAPLTQPRAAAPLTQPKPAAPLTQPKPAAPLAQPRVGAPATQPRVGASATQPRVGSASSRFGAPSASGTRPGAPAQPATKTSGLNIQSATKKK